MTKYLFQGSYTEKGLEGLSKEGGSKRREAVEKAIRASGGKLEMFYFCFGGDDFAVVFDLPSSTDAAAVALAVGASGAVRGRTTVLIAPEEMDQAASKVVDYRPPGQ
jgi:uncharacterized protein with GYD domain